MYVTLGTATGPNLSLKRKAFEENKKHPSRTSMFLLRFILMIYSSDHKVRYIPRMAALMPQKPLLL